MCEEETEKSVIKVIEIITKDRTKAFLGLAPGMNSPKNEYVFRGETFKINGAKPLRSFKMDYFQVPLASDDDYKASVLIKKLASPAKYVLVNKPVFEALKNSLSSDSKDAFLMNLKEEYLASEVTVETEDEDGDRVSKLSPSFQMVVSLFELKGPEYVYIEDTDSYIIEVVETYVVDKIEKPETFGYDVVNMRRGVAGGRGTEIISAKHSIINEIMLPSLLLQNSPSFITSEDAYKIVREFVKNNIDTKYATITSDYDFCFAVEKVVKLSEPESYKVRINASKKKAAPVYETRLNDVRKVSIFKMTTSKAKQSGYPIIEGFKGDTEQDLFEKIDKFLKDLISYINAPVVDCPCCKGKGVTFPTEKDVNDLLKHE